MAPPNPIPPMHPYNKTAVVPTPPSSTPAASTVGASPNPSASASAGSAAAGSAARPAPAVTTALRPSYGLVSTTDRSRDIGARPYNAPSLLSRSSDPAPNTTSSSTPHTHNHSQSVPPHHHHHHHHHIHSHTSSGNNAASTPVAPASSDRPSSFSGLTPNAAASNASRIMGAPKILRPGDNYPFGHRLGLFPELDRERERQRKEAESKALADADRERRTSSLLGPTSPKASTGASTLSSFDSDPYKRSTSSVQTSPKASTSTTTPMGGLSTLSRTSLPPSPTNTRPLPAPSSASSASATAKPSISPQLQTLGTVTGLPSARPNLPGLSTISSRALPSPFDIGHERSTSSSTNQDAPATGHQRTLSNSSNRPSDPVSALGRRSPEKLTAQTTPASRGLFNGPPPLPQPSRDSAIQRSPVARPSTATSPREPTRDAAPATSAQAKPATSGASTTSSQAQQPRTHPYTFSYGSSSYVSPYLGLGGSFGGYGISWEEREKARDRERQREKERLDREMDRRRRLEEEQERYNKAREEERRLWAQMREDYERDAQRKREERDKDRKEFEGKIAAYSQPKTTQTQDVKPFQPQRHPQASSTSTAPAAATAAYTDPYRRPPQTAATASTYNSRIEVLNETPQYPQEPGSVMQQVAPQREPRPYGYKTESRDYAYTPREKRPRMDAAVEEQAHRRGSVGKSKRRKEDAGDKLKDIAAPAPRDWTALVQPNKKDPEVTSAPVEAWLKTVPDLNRIVGREVYGGCDWILARSDCMDPENAGSIVTVRVGGGFLGKGWKVRGEAGWDEASAYGTGNSQVGLVWAEGREDERRIWGTDVYTDDSDVGLVLVHAGWIRWGGEPSKADENQVNVTVRIVPPLVRYASTERNRVRTRGWGNGHDGMSIVVEAVERVKLDKKWLSARANKKARMAEYARQRSFVLPLEERRANMDDVVVLVKGSAGGLKYSPEALGDYLDPDAARSLWAYNLVLTSESESYRLSLLNSDLRLHLTQPTRNNAAELRGDIGDDVNMDAKPEDEVLATDLPVTEFHWVPEGLAVRIHGRKGLLCLVETFRWEKRTEELVPPGGEELGEEVKMERGSVAAEELAAFA